MVQKGKFSAAATVEPLIWQINLYIEYIRVNISVSPCIHHIRGVKVTLSIDAKLASKQLLAPSPATNLSDAT